MNMGDVLFNNTDVLNVINEYQKHVRAGFGEAQQAEAIIATIDERVKTLVMEHLHRVTGLSVEECEHYKTADRKGQEMTAFKEAVLQSINPSGNLRQVINRQVDTRINDLRREEEIRMTAGEIFSSRSPLTIHLTPPSSSRTLPTLDSILEEEDEEPFGTPPSLESILDEPDDDLPPLTPPSTPRTP